MAACLCCAAPLEPFMSFGRMPIANGFLTPDQFASEYFFDLQVGFCEACGMVQLTERVDRDRMFNESYAFYSSTSSRMAAHFEELAADVRTRHLRASDPFVVEIGSNDGIMLRHFALAGVRHLGIEPSANVAKAAMDKGIHTVCRFFDETLAREIVSQHGQADAFLGANVMCHLPYLHSVVAGIKLLLKPSGVLIFEDPYLGDIVEKTSYDQIYDEHAFYFSLAALRALFDRHDMEIVDVAPQDVHGGSMRYVVAHKGAREASAGVRNQLAQEERLGLGRADTFRKLRSRIEESRNNLVKLLRDLRKQGKRIVGYGATSKSTTVTNYCGITPDVVECISDTTPIKQGKYSPGAHIPVRPYRDFSSRYPDYALLFAWNHSGEIMAKEDGFKRAGGKWIVYVPEVKILG